MIVRCDICKFSFEDEYRSHCCPHETFAANDGRNNFAHHPGSYLGAANGGNGLGPKVLEYAHNGRRIDIQREIGDWYRNNGGHAGITAAIERTKKEFDELTNATTPEHIREEAADAAMCLFTVAEIAGFDLISAMTDKLAINEQRKWTVDSQGCLHHVKGSDPRE
jgi:NTP pyrophosphatase (non-canonical NTP hydrolase)